MPLSCSCDWDGYDFEPGDWQYWFLQRDIDFSVLDGWRAKRCKSCDKLINVGEFCVRFPRYRYPYNEIEARITGNDWDCFEEPNIRVADHFHCEKCGEIWLNLTVTAGFECLAPYENMPEMLKEYQYEYEPPKLKLHTP